MAPTIVDVRAATPRLIVIEDDVALREALTVALQGEGYEVMAAPDGSTFVDTIGSFRPDLALLDVRLPEGPDGLSLARRLRATSDVPVLFLTAADTVQDRLAGFDAGGDDYLVKPFSMAELLARVHALLRRSGRLASVTWQVDDLIVDEGARTVTRGGEAIELTRTEFDLLAALGKRIGKVVPKPQLLTLVWEFDSYDPNLVEVHVSALRRKLEAHGPRLIHTVRGVGYVLRP
jgi:two-component system, OmpR family, response regulator